MQKARFNKFDFYAVFTPKITPWPFRREGMTVIEH